MAAKNPLVLYSGKIKELQAGDTINGAVATVEIKQLELIFDPPASPQKAFVVDDGDCHTASFIMATIAFDYGSDEGWTMPSFIIGCGDAEEGRFRIFIKTADGSPIEGTYRFNYIIS